MDGLSVTSNILFSEGCSPELGELIILLVVEYDESVRVKVAESLNLPVAWFAIFARDRSHQVRISISENPLIPSYLLEELVLDQHPDVRYAMAANPNLPLPILAVLSEDENPYVSVRASRTIGRLQKETRWLRACA